jgi:hypothetical protein
VRTGGRLDREKLRAFVESVRRVDAELLSEACA